MPNKRKEGKKCFSAWLDEQILDELKKHVRDNPKKYADFTEFIEKALKERLSRDKPKSK